ncbi:TIGR01244 family phosphatase [Croceicoccus ponticola]|uniref:TIGR01244 family phosphatase n=1 Tax=Croceicoccus ponticola TaxID=2217664 RepID=A0A437H240_9SPHN|nr:TIGR01244 family sulfur transferase [Croceicoccus ponticola]RVQ69708.1 TIGR01244 family phosphatase [Croceicoccus ponticola]
MTDFREIDDNLLASPQISVEDVATAKSLGVTLIINNRPDNESDDQPAGADIEAAARAAGIDYVAIPVGHAGFGLGQVEAMRDALDHANGKVLAYCRSGTRSTLLWALAEAKAGKNPSVIASKASHGGYDISPIRQMVEMLSAGG